MFETAYNCIQPFGLMFVNQHHQAHTGQCEKNYDKEAFTIKKKREVGSFSSFIFLLLLYICVF